MNVFRAFIGFAVMTLFLSMTYVAVIDYFHPKHGESLRKDFSLPLFLIFLLIVCILPALCGALLLDVAANS